MGLNSLIYSVLILFFGAATGVTAAASEAISADQIAVEIVADDGSVFARYDLASYSRRGNLRAYLEAERGRNYGIRVRNHTSARIGLVIAVDAARDAEDNTPPCMVCNL